MSREQFDDGDISVDSANRLRVYVSGKFLPISTTDIQAIKSWILDMDVKDIKEISEYCKEIIKRKKNMENLVNDE